MIVGNVGNFLLGLSLVSVDGAMTPSALKGKTFKAFRESFTKEGVKSAQMTVQNSKSVAAIDTDVTYCTKFNWEDTACENLGSLDSIQVNTCIALANEDEGFESVMYTAEDTTGEGTWTITQIYYTDDACTDEMSDNSMSGTEVCTEGVVDYTVECTTDSSPWDAAGDGVYTKYYVDSECDSDPYYVYAFTSGCHAFGDDFAIKVKCSGDSVTVTPYNDAECSGDVADDDYFTGGDDDMTFDECAQNDDGFDDSFVLSSEGYNEVTCEGGGGGDDSVCFAAHEMVMMANGEQRAISQVQVGDKVLTMSAEGTFVYSDVVFVPHPANDKAATFFTLAMDNGRTLSVTSNHMVSGGVCGSHVEHNLVRVDDLSIGDCVYTVDGESRVASVDMYRGEGVYTLVTAEANGKLVVNGVVASSFGINHEVVNAYYNIHRMLYSVFPGLMTVDAVVKTNEMLGTVVASI